MLNLIAGLVIAFLGWLLGRAIGYVIGFRGGRSLLERLRSFAAGIKRDQAAVLAALTYEWSQGQVEGQIHRLKLLKRQSYGQAGFDLLRHRVLARSA